MIVAWLAHVRVCKCVGLWVSVVFISACGMLPLDYAVEPRLTAGGNLVVTVVVVNTGTECYGLDSSSLELQAFPAAGASAPLWRYPIDQRTTTLPVPDEDAVINIGGTMVVMLAPNETYQLSIFVPRREIPLASGEYHLKLLTQYYTEPPSLDKQQQIIEVGTLRVP